MFVWNTNEYQHDENENCVMSELDKPDPCMRAQNEITLHETDDVGEDDERELHVSILRFRFHLVEMTINQFITFYIRV